MPPPTAQLPLPLHLAHQPVFALPFHGHDPGREGNTDCQYLSVGWAQWDDKELSAKVFRHAAQRWSRQSEELPLPRLVDLVTLLVMIVRHGAAGSITIPPGTFEQQPDATILGRVGSGGAEDFFVRSLESDLLRRRLDRLTDELVARRADHAAGSAT